MGVEIAEVKRKIEKIQLIILKLCKLLTITGAAVDTTTPSNAARNIAMRKENAIFV